MSFWFDLFVILPKNLLFLRTLYDIINILLHLKIQYNFIVEKKNIYKFVNTVYIPSVEPSKIRKLWNTDDFLCLICAGLDHTRLQKFGLFSGPTCVRKLHSISLWNTYLITAPVHTGTGIRKWIHCVTGVDWARKGKDTLNCTVSNNKACRVIFLEWILYANYVLIFNLTHFLYLQKLISFI